MILSIESSCDDSSIAVTQIDSKKLLFHKKISQDEQHSAHGGVVPELASRLHAVCLPNILEEAKQYLLHLKAVAVTNEPGLVVSLLEGVTMAKVLCLSLKLPLLPINHLIGHIYSLFIEKPTVFPLSLLLVSGGHTQIMEAKSFDEVRVFAKTMDDSFGESFDKAAKMLGLGYPGGPCVEEAAKDGNPLAFALPRPLQDPRAAFSFSGLKNALRLQIVSYENIDEQTKRDLAASFQKVAIDHIMHKTRKYFEQAQPKTFAVVGGASANTQLRQRLLELCKKHDTRLLLAPLEFCSDNAAMIGRAGIDAYELKRFCEPNMLEVHSRADLAAL